MNKQLIIALFLVGLISCKKERDEEYPDVSFQNPGISSNHQVLNPIPFKVVASDETHLERITVHLLNDSYLPVASSVTFNCDENTEIFESSILTEDIHLPSGTYYLKAVAFDGFNEKVAYREIHLTEVTRVLKKVWVLSQPMPNTITLDSISGTNLVTGFNLSQDYGGFMANSYHQLMSVAGGNNGDLSVLYAEYPSIKFAWTNTGSGSTPFYTSLLVKEDKTFVAESSGLIRSFRKTSPAVDVVDLGNYYSESFTVMDDLIISASVLSTGLQKSIQVYYLSSSSLMQGVISTLDAKKMFVLNSDEILIFGNESGIGKIKSYSISGNNLTEPIVFSGGKIHDACEISTGNYLIAHENGIHLYESGLNNQTSLVSGNPFQLIRFDDLSGNFYTAHGNLLTSYSLSPLTLIQNYTSADSIVGLDLLYNK